MQNTVLRVVIVTADHFVVTQFSEQQELRKILDAQKKIKAEIQKLRDKYDKLEGEARQAKEDISKLENDTYMEDIPAS